MPASTCDPVETALRARLEKGRPLDGQQLAGATKNALLADIEFEPAGSYQSQILDKLKSKYIVLKSGEASTTSSPEKTMTKEDGLKQPRRELFPLESVQLGWKNNREWTVGAGMVNMGNTCYLNSTLQALFHVPALVNWLISEKDHLADCQDSAGLCIICAMRKTLQESQQRNISAIRPLLIYNKLRLVCRNLIPGRQEDAHEFLRYLVEAMEKSYLNRFKNRNEFDSRTKETTPLNQILGGYLRSAVRCLKCGHVSTTFQHFQDLLLDIRKATTIEDALDLYFSREKLDDESYHCESCQRKVPATKQFSLERAPMVLCIQLKRFSVSNNKITKQVAFRGRLDLTRFARQKPSVPLLYRLASIVTHMGPTVTCGHYTAVAQAPSGNFYQFDDSMVRPISQQTMLNTNAYIMFYELETSPHCHRPTGTPAKLKAATQPPATEVAGPTGSTSHMQNKLSIGFTSDKVYGPELPPERASGLVTSTSTSTCINSKRDNCSTSSTSSSSESEEETIIIKTVSSDTPPSPPIKEADSSTSDLNVTDSLNQGSPSPDASPPRPSPSSRVSTSISSLSSLSSPDSSPKQKESPTSTTASLTAVKPPPTPVTSCQSLVPYEGDTSSEDSNQSPTASENAATAESVSLNGTRVSTKAAVADWQVTSSTDIEPEGPSSEGRTWEKKRPQQSCSNTVAELLKMSSTGYSAPVSSWSGTRSQLDKEVANERREERKRSLADSSDQGRVKHPKMGNGDSNGYKSNPGYNPVQEYHNAKNWNNGGHYNKPFYNGNRHRRNFHHKNFHKNNYRFR